MLSQSISNIEFRKTEWFTTNKDSLFFKSDTLKLIKYSNPIKEIKELYVESEFFNDSESIILKFGKNKHLNFYNKKFHMYSLSLKKWNLNKKDSILRIGNEKETKLIFKIISIKKLKFIKDEEELETIEMLVVKNNYFQYRL